MDINHEWMQALFDLMANKYTELTVSGVFYAVDAELKVETWQGNKRVMQSVAEVVGADDFETAMSDLMQQAQSARALLDKARD